jgi:hypothetical protein
MTEVARAGERHGNAAFVRCCNHIRVTNGTARLDGCSGTGIRSCDEAIGKWEESVTANDA